ncbi:MAG: hypothetical protein VB853_00040 [Pirellulales bacterium]
MLAESGSLDRTELPHCWEKFTDWVDNSVGPAIRFRLADIQAGQYLAAPAELLRKWTALLFVRR